MKTYNLRQTKSKFKINRIAKKKKRKLLPIQISGFGWLQWALIIFRNQFCIIQSKWQVSHLKVSKRLCSGNIQWSMGIRQKKCHTKLIHNLRDGAHFSLHYHSSMQLLENENDLDHLVGQNSMILMIQTLEFQCDNFT